MPTIVTKIEGLEKKIAGYEQRLNAIDRNLRLEEITNHERENLLEEESKLQQVMKDQKQQLSSLRGENRKTMLVSVILLVLVYLAYNTFWNS